MILSLPKINYNNKSNILYFGNKPEIPPKEKTVSVLGTSKNNKGSQQFLQLIQDCSAELASKGFYIITGASSGANEAGNLGASSVDINKSLVIRVKPYRNYELDEINNEGKQIFKELTSVNSGSERTGLINKYSNYMLISPGGPGSLQEIAVALENIYYKVENAPKKIIVLGKNFYKPLKDLLNNMVKCGFVTNEIYNAIEFVNIENPKQAQKDIINIICNGESINKKQNTQLKPNFDIIT